MSEAKIILSNDPFRSALKVYVADNGPNGAQTLIGTYRENVAGGWGAELGDGTTFHAETKAALRSKIAAYATQPQDTGNG